MDIWTRNEYQREGRVQWNLSFASFVIIRRNGNDFVPVVIITATILTGSSYCVFYRGRFCLFWRTSINHADPAVLLSCLSFFLPHVCLLARSHAIPTSQHPLRCHFSFPLSYVDCRILIFICCVRGEGGENCKNESSPYKSEHCLGFNLLLCYQRDSSVFFGYVVVSCRHVVDGSPLFVNSFQRVFWGARPWCDLDKLQCVRQSIWKLQVFNTRGEL